MFDILKCIKIVEGRLEEYYQHNETGQHYQAISALQIVLNDLNNVLHAEMLIMDMYAQEFNENGGM